MDPCKMSLGVTPSLPKSEYLPSPYTSLILFHPPTSLAASKVSLASFQTREDSSAGNKVSVNGSSA